MQAALLERENDPIDVHYLTAEGAVARPLTAEGLLPAQARYGAEQVAEHVAAALDAPVELPPLSQALTDEDSIAIALQPGVPQGAAVAAGVVDYLIEQGMASERIVVTLADRHQQVVLEQELEELLPAGLRVETHMADDQEQLCFAGLAVGDRPLLVARSLFEADVLLPILAQRPHSAQGPFDGLFPHFFDQPTQDRVSRVRSVAGARARGGEHAERRRAESRHAGWQVGAPLVLRVIAGREGALPKFVAGAADASIHEAESVALSTWKTEVPEASSLTVLTLGDDPHEQDWAALGRALEQIDPLVPSGGMLALWTDLASPIGEALGRLIDVEGDLLSLLAEDAGEEAWAAWQLAQALERGPLFLRSQLDPDLVESLGIAPLESFDELQRLVERSGGCNLVEGAQHVRWANAL